MLLRDLQKQTIQRLNVRTKRSNKLLDKTSVLIGSSCGLLALLPSVSSKSLAHVDVPLACEVQAAGITMWFVTACADDPRLPSWLLVEIMRGTLSKGLQSIPFRHGGRDQG